MYAMHLFPIRKKWLHPTSTIKIVQSKAVFSRQITAPRDALIFLDAPRNGQLPDFCSCTLLFPLGRDQISDLDPHSRSFIYFKSFSLLTYSFLHSIVHTQLRLFNCSYQNGPLQTRRVEYPGWSQIHRLPQSARRCKARGWLTRIEQILVDYYAGAWLSRCSGTYFTYIYVSNC